MRQILYAFVVSHTPRPPKLKRPNRSSRTRQMFTSEVFTIRSDAFWYATPCSLVETCRYFWGTVAEEGADEAPNTHRKNCYSEYSSTLKIEALGSSEVSVNSKTTRCHMVEVFGINTNFCRGSLFFPCLVPPAGCLALCQIERRCKSRHFYLMMSPHPLSISYHCQYLFQFPKTPLSYLSYLLPFLSESISPLSFSVMPSNGYCVWNHFFPHKGTEFCCSSLMKRLLNPPRIMEPNDLETCIAVIAIWL
jgi:hypothetical protein